MSFGYQIKFKRRREGKTNYRKRLALVKSGLPRLAVRISNQKVYAQLIVFNLNGDEIIAAAESSELEKLGWKKGLTSTPCAYLTGYLVAKRALASGKNEAVLDIGMKTPSRGARIFALAKGAIDAGMNVSCDPDKFPAENRIKGIHLGGEATKMFTEVFKKIEGKDKNE
jgi:large subunit ribosomal protein L18